MKLQRYRGRGCSYFGEKEAGTDEGCRIGKLCTQNKRQQTCQDAVMYICRNPVTSEGSPDDQLPENTSGISSRQEELQSALRQAQADAEAARQGTAQA